MKESLPLEPASEASIDRVSGLHNAMLLAREADRRESILYRQGRGWFLLPSAGHEPMAVFAQYLRPDDYKFLYYRDRALLLALGWSIRQMALEYFACDASSSRGRQMPAFAGDKSQHIVTLAPPTGLQCLPAAGCAWACKLHGRGQIVLCTIGDAATREGEFYEALCFSQEHSLPIVFVVEDNGWGISTPTSATNPLSLGILDDRRVTRVDGRDLDSLAGAAASAILGARQGQGPSILWLSLDRLGSHSASDDQKAYRTPRELERIVTRDFLPDLLPDPAAPSGGLVELIAAEYEKAESAEAPRYSPDCDVFARDVPPARAHGLPARTSWTMASAIAETLRSLLAEDPRVVLCGQDIEDPKGGVFGLTRGLSSQYPGRVVNAPLAEATIAGVASGLALSGFLPIFEIQFVDFAATAFNQIFNQIATLRWRSNGMWSNPLILIMPVGGYLHGAGPWHSQSNEGLFAHAPGLKVVVPSTPHDAAALLRAAAAGMDPVIFLAPKHLFRQPMPAPAGAPAIRLGEAAVRCPGPDVTVIAWGNCVEIALAAAEALKQESILAEVIDLRCLVPCDWESIRNSLSKTGRLVVVQEDNRTASFGQSLIADVVSRLETWNLLAAQPELVSRPDVHVGFHPDLTAAVLPSPADVANAVRRTLGV